MGYKSISKIDHHLSRKYSSLKAMYDRPHKSSPCRNMEWWLGRGRPLDPGLTTFGSFPNLEISNWHLKSAICTSRFKNSRNTQLVVSGYRGGSSM
jgi:hypothetical protein